MPGVLASLDDSNETEPIGIRLCDRRLVVRVVADTVFAILVARKNAVVCALRPDLIAPSAGNLGNLVWRYAAQRLVNESRNVMTTPEAEISWLNSGGYPRATALHLTHRTSHLTRSHRQVLQMTLRKHHPNGNWCNALEKNIKGFIREFDNQLTADMKMLSELRFEMKRLLEVMRQLPSESHAINVRDHSLTEREAEQIALQVGNLAALAFINHSSPPSS